MDSSTQEIYFQKLQELIEDEDEIVTVSSLSKALKISVQDSAKILNQYLEDSRKLKPELLAATYILTGTLKNGKGKAYCLVKDHKIQSKQQEFEEVNCEILYSVQKSKDIDFSVLAVANWPNLTISEEKPKPLFGTVISKNCTRRTLKFKILPPPPIPTLRGKSSFFAPKTEPKANGNSTDVNGAEKNSKNVSNSNSGTITSLFAKSTEKQKTVEKKPVSKDKSTKGSLSDFFSKSSSNISSNGSMKTEKSLSVNDPQENGFQQSESEKTSESEKSEALSNVPLDNGELGSDIEMKQSEKLPQEERSSRSMSSTKKNKQESRKSSKRARENSKEKSTKRRKRIIETEDSESEDIFENDENEDVIEKSDDEPERDPSPIPVKPLAPKNKKRVAVDRHYVDEEGFMVTQKEYVYESASEDEIKIPQCPEKKDEKQPPKFSVKNSVSSETDTSPQRNGKGKKAKKNAVQNQPTLMNFFRKK